jgi:hypothetical protein
MMAERLEFARSRSFGLNIVSIENAAAKLAGGFARPIDPVELRKAVVDVIDKVDLGELQPISELPGVPSAVAKSLMKLWLAGVDIQSSSAPRLQALAKVETAVMAALPPSAMRPQDIVAAARDRTEHAASLLGPVRIKGVTEMQPIWRPLLDDLARTVGVIWEAGPREYPGWLAETAIKVETSAAETPDVAVISCASARHEVVEAIRWVRERITSGAAAPGDIAIVAASTADYDDLFAALSADANIGIHVAHSVKAIGTRDGQAAAALADLLLRGLSQKRVRRLMGLSRPEGLEDGWHKFMPQDASLTDVDRWRAAYGSPEAKPFADVLLPFIEMTDRGPDVAQQIGELALTGRALLIWRRALETGPAAALDATVQNLRVDDGLDPLSSPVFASAAAIAAAPRAHVRLIGLSSRGWPRGTIEDALVPDHVVANAELNPLPLVEADKRDFRTILATTKSTVTMTFARRDAEGRALGRSPLLPRDKQVLRLRRSRTPEHAVSESDRLFARPTEFAESSIAIAARACWRNWHSDELTGHDGMVRPNHPRMLAALDRIQSATSLAMMIRNPLAFALRYGLGLTEPEDGDDPLTLDGRAFGNLVHAVLQGALGALEAAGGVTKATPAAIHNAIADAAHEAAKTFERESPIPPKLIWERILARVDETATAAMTFAEAPLIGQRSFSEVPFGGEDLVEGVELPWDGAAPVWIPGTDIAIKGRIDRFDLSGNGSVARVKDYKTGKPWGPKGAEKEIDGGKELQRCIYASAVKALLGDVEVQSALLFTKDGSAAPLVDPDATLTKLSGYLNAAKASLASGRAVPGKDAADDFDGMRFALPANAKAVYVRRKETAVLEAIPSVSAIWEQP